MRGTLDGKWSELLLRLGVAYELASTIFIALEACGPLV